MMRKYLYTILLCVSCLAALPFVTKKVFGPLIEAKKNQTDMSDGEIEEDYFGTPPEDRPGADEVPETVNPPVTTEPPVETKTPATEGPSVTESPKETEEPPVETKAPETEAPEEIYEFTKVDREYFKDALFIGDSRTVGLSEYADLNGAHVFADTGMNVYKLKDKKVDVKGVGKRTLEGLLKEQTYGKIYVMLGINELGYDQKQTVKKFAGLIEDIRALQPEAVIFIGANLHITAKKSSTSKIYNNKNIDWFNNEISKLEDKKDIFYIDVNELFDDEKGNLDEQYTADASHVLGKYYSVWADWLLEKGIVK